MLEWNNLRSWNGTQSGGFEELCCQLARYELAPTGSKFFRVRAPDAGVECYWRLPNGDEWGWQSKFFPGSPGEDQWRQLDGSVRTALDKRPRLTRYTVCLPDDRQEPRIEDQKWSMDKWNERVDKWRSWAQEKAMSVDFEYWGASEIFGRLSREEHAGRRYFWFNAEELSQEWFRRRLEEAIADVGARYTPALNVELPIARVFDGLGRTPGFIRRLKEHHGALRRAYKDARPRKEITSTVRAAYDNVARPTEVLLEMVAHVDEVDDAPIEFDSLEQLAREGADAAFQCIGVLGEAAEEIKKKRRQEQKRPAEYEADPYALETYGLYSLIRELRHFENYASLPEARSVNARAVLFAGEAGTGKTHLFCDVATNRIASGQPTVVLLGAHFTPNDEPWSRMVSRLQLSCAKAEEFLGALQAAAEASDSRALILIDALNEGGGPALWRTRLGSLLTTVSRFPRVSVALSIRSSYEPVTVPEGLVPGRLVRVVHHGFADHEYEAARAFFSHFGIEQPSVPLLVPEFQNPLFLKVLCTGLQNAGMTRIPDGLEGVTKVFNLFLDSLNEKLARAEYLSFGVGLPRTPLVVHGAVAGLVGRMTQFGTDWLPFDDAESLVIGLRASQGDGGPLFGHLVSEGLLAEDIFPSPDGAGWIQGVRFAYQRFADHFIVRNLLDQHLDKENPAGSFGAEQPLGSLLKDERAAWRHRGLLDALSIQVPEYTGKELVELVPFAASWEPVRRAFIESLVWREPSSIGDAAVDYINEYVIKSQDGWDQLQEVFLTVATKPRHPFNGDSLHRNLLQQRLPERDATWSAWLHYQYGERGAVDRLIDWAWSPEDKSHIDDEPMRLCAVALAWFLTSSNRFLRDRATKALVALLTNRMQVLRKVVAQFLEVDDPYVLERLTAAAYGCALRTQDGEGLAALAQDTYGWFFKDGAPPVHVLLRDYARGVIETAHKQRGDLDIELDLVRPPYKSEWPEHITSEAELKKYGERQEHMPDEEWSRLHLYDSVMGFGDFARYVLGADLAHSRWSSRRLGDPRTPSRRELHQRFVDSLTRGQRLAWSRYAPLRRGVLLVREVDETGREGDSFPGFSAEDLSTARAEAEKALRKMLGINKSRQLDQIALPYLDDPTDEHRFDVSIAQRWIFQKVLDLGWTVERFGRFDRRGGADHRQAHKAERIGKKYQWIAYHEFLAMLADNFELRSDPWGDQPEAYEGPWQFGARDIDPSCLLKPSPAKRTDHEGCWWSRPYSAWDLDGDDTTWLQRDDDVPDVKRLMVVERNDDGAKWLTFQGFYLWQQPIPPEEERFEQPQREIWYRLQSHVVRREHVDDVFEWITQQKFKEGTITPRIYDVFLGEYPWSPSFEYEDKPYYSRAGWTRPQDEAPGEMLFTGDEYAAEGNGFDCSFDDTFSVQLPAKWIVDRMNLRWNGEEGSFLSVAGELVAFDPSVTESGPEVLLVRHDAFLELLKDNGCDVVWTLQAEKRILGGISTQTESPGYLEIYGAFRMRGETIEGSVETKFISRGGTIPST